MHVGEGMEESRRGQRVVGIEDEEQHEEDGMNERMRQRVGIEDEEQHEKYGK